MFLTLCAVEHAKAVSVMMAKELPNYDGMMLLNYFQISLVEFFCEPRFTSFLLKETWRNMSNDVDLREKAKSQ